MPRNRCRANGAAVTKSRKGKLEERLRNKIAIRQGEKKICLTGIVRNESANIERLLNSVQSVVDMISLVDTGSTDNTAELITAWGLKHNIPTTVHHEAFQDFAYNRTHSVTAAKAAYPEADYFLLTDADFVWEINKGGKFDKILLVDHKYLIEQYNKALSYWNVRLLSAKVDWECVGLTHEYWQEAKKQSEYHGEVRTHKIKTLVIDDREDGGCKHDKFERDERLLRQGIADTDPIRTPKGLKTRYKFYLAQTLKDMQRFEESIEWYQKRLEDKGWAEEIYYAKYQIGFNYEQLGWRYKHLVRLIAKADKTEAEIADLDKYNTKCLTPQELARHSTEYLRLAAVNYQAAYEFRKWRAESLYSCCRMYRVLGLHQEAYQLYTIGKKIAYPQDDTLFIQTACYGYLWDYEAALCCFYIPGKKEEGREAIAGLLARTDLSESMRQHCEAISRHYI